MLDLKFLQLTLDIAKRWKLHVLFLIVVSAVLLFHYCSWPLIVQARLNLPITATRIKVSEDWLLDYYHPLKMQQEGDRCYQHQILKKWADEAYALISEQYPNLERDQHLELLAQSCAIETSRMDMESVNELGFNWMQLRLNAICTHHIPVCWGWPSSGDTDPKNILGLSLSSGVPHAYWDHYYSRFTHFGIGLFYDHESPNMYTWFVVLARLPVNTSQLAWLEPKQTVPSSIYSDDFILAAEWRDAYYHSLPGINSQYGVYGNEELLSFASEAYRLVNETRSESNISVLRRENHYEAIAQAYARYMAKMNHYGHSDLVGLFPSHRLLAVSPPVNSVIYENLHMIQLSNDMPYDVHSAWLQSEKHCLNMLHEQHEYVGIGVYPAGEDYDEYYFWVQVFGTTGTDPALNEWIEPGQ